jgi:protease IV
VIDELYRDFVGKAAAARKLDTAKVEAHAQGRVWTGTQAVERGLLDRTGSFDDAIKAARSRAQLPDSAALKWIEPERGRVQQLLDMVGARAVADAAREAVISTVTSLGLPGSVPAASPWAAADALSAGSLRQDLLFWQQQVQRAAQGDMAGTVHCLCTGWSSP